MSPSSGMMPGVSDCVFCKIVAGDAPATIVEEWADTIVIVPLHPVVDGHVLVIPRDHVVNFWDHPGITEAVMYRAACFAQTHAAYAQCNLITSAGEAATQTVMHLHVHLVPRSDDDGLSLPWTGQET